MPSVKVRDGESFDSAIRRFKRAVEKAGIPKELRKREFFQKGSVLKQRRIVAAKKRLLKRLSHERFILSGAEPRRESRAQY